MALLDGSGRAIGRVTVSGATGRTRIAVDAGSLSAGAHGIHLHEKGVCAGPRFESAGGHWNPAGRKHGRDNPLGAHMGDLPNLAAGSGGRAATSLVVTVPPAALADADGTSLVVHAKPDDYRTDPSGASGERIACAVLTAPLSKGR